MEKPKSLNASVAAPLSGVTMAAEWALELFAPLRKSEPVAWERCDKINATVIEKIQREAFEAGQKASGGLPAAMLEAFNSGDGTYRP